LVPLIPIAEQDKIIDQTFNTPKTRYTALLGVFDGSMPTEAKLIKSCEDYNAKSEYDSELPDYQPNFKENVKLINYSQNSILLYYTLTTRKAEYDYDAMESRPIIYAKKVRVVITPNKNKVSVFTGDRDLFNNAMTALTVIFGKVVKPLDLNKTGISNLTAGSFSFHTVKVLDFIYHGLSKIGNIGAIKEIDLETSKNSKNPQKVKVQGDELLDDKSICEYLFIHARDLVGLKLELNFNIGQDTYKSNIEISIRDNRIKIGIKKEKLKIDQIQQLFEILEDNAHLILSQFGLIDGKNTEKILEQIKNRAMSR